MYLHQTKIQSGHDDENYHHKCQDRIQIIRNRWQEQLKSCNTSIIRHIRIDSCRPAGNRCDNTYRCSCCINNICQFGSGYLVTVCDRSHNRTNCQAVKIIIHKNQHTKSCCCQHCTLFAFNLSSGPFTIRSRTTRFRHQNNDHSQQHIKYQNI